MHEEEKKAFEALQAQLVSFKEELTSKAGSEGLTKVSGQLEKLQGDIDTMKEKDVDKMITDINSEITKFRQQVIDLREEQARLKDNGSGSGKKKEVFVSRKDIEAFINQTFKDGEKTSIKASIAMKAPENFGYDQTFQGAAGTQIDAFTGRFVDPTLYQRKRKRNLILDHIPILSIEVPKLLYLEKVEIGTGTAPNNLSGGADWIVSGGEKPLRSFRVTTGEVEAKKVAIFGTIEDKLLRDVPSFENWITEDFQSEMLEKYNDGLLNNNPAVNADAPLGLKQNAVLFDVTPAFDETILSADYIDAIVAASASMADKKEQPMKIFVATDVFYALHVLKDSEGAHRNKDLVYTNAVGQLFIAGVEVVESDSEDVPSTHFLLISADLGFKIHNYGGMTMERGLNGTDFRHDRTSYRGYQEVLSFIPTHRINSVMYDTWTNVLTAIEKPVV
jgi:hypothetical protein